MRELEGLSSSPVYTLILLTEMMLKIDQPKPNTQKLITMATTPPKPKGP